MKNNITFKSLKALLFENVVSDDIKKIETAAAQLQVKTPELKMYYEVTHDTDDNLVNVSIITYVEYKTAAIKAINKFVKEIDGLPSIDNIDVSLVGEDNIGQMGYDINIYLK